MREPGASGRTRTPIAASFGFPPRALSSSEPAQRLSSRRPRGFRRSRRLASPLALGPRMPAPGRCELPLAISIEAARGGESVARGRDPRPLGDGWDGPRSDEWSSRSPGTAHRSMMHATWRRKPVWALMGGRTVGSWTSHHDLGCPPINRSAAGTVLRGECDWAVEGDAYGATEPGWEGHDISGPS